MLVTAPSFSVVEKADTRKHHTFERLMIFTATVRHLWFGWSSSLPPRWMIMSLGVSTERETRALRMASSEGDDMLSMQSWHRWNASDRLCRRQTLRATISFAVFFFTSSFCLLLSVTILHCVAFTGSRWIPESKVELLIVVMSSS